MNWITNYVRPKLGKVLNRRETPDNLWHKCTACNQMIFHRDLVAALNVCTHCNHHMAISPKARFDDLFDGGIYTDIDTPKPVVDPLSFKDEKKYTDRLRDARKKTGDQDAAHVAKGNIAGMAAVAFVQNFSFMGGSMGMAVGDALLKAADTAVSNKAPLIVFAAAGGARMQEGILSLMQMPRTTIAVQMMREAKLPYIVVFTHPTTGGVTASYAMLGDFHIAEPNALICFAGPRVIEQTIREKLPEGFQRSEYLLEHGMLDMVVSRSEMRDALANLILLAMNQPPENAGVLPAPDNSDTAIALSDDSDKA